MSRSYPLNLKTNAKELRKFQTDAEKKIWSHLKHKQILGVKFRRQYIIAPYIVDFVCLSANIVIEIDGGQHSYEVDHYRDEYIQSQGYEILRFWNNEVFENIEGVLQVIYNKLLSVAPHLASPLQGEEY